MWLSDGRPNRGALHDVMCWARNKYHYAIRKVKKLSDQIRAEKLLDASNSGEANLWKEMKNIKGKQKKGQSLPESVDGAKGPEEILNKFKEVYETLYNSSESIESMNIIKTRINHLITEDSVCLLYTSPSPRD